MQTTMRALTGRPGAVRQPWLLALLVLGIVGMHGLVLGGGAAAGHHSTAPPVVPAAATGHTQAHDHGAASSVVHAPLPGAPVAEEEVDSSVLVLCMALMLALALGVFGVRRTTVVSLVDRLMPRLVLPRAPMLRDRTPVPRFTVMRC